MTEQNKCDQAEAAALQSWLVGNARTIRPMDNSGLMGWALAALKRQAELLLERAPASDVEAGLRAELATQTARADAAVGDANEAERRVALAVPLVQHLKDLAAECPILPISDFSSELHILRRVLNRDDGQVACKENPAAPTTHKRIPRLDDIAPTPADKLALGRGELQVAPR